MSRFRLTILGLLVLALFAGSAEASSFTLNGAGDEGVIIWDGTTDVRTSNSNCTSLQPCLTNTSAALAAEQLYVRLTIPNLTTDLNLFTLHLTYARPIAEGCQVFSGITCIPSLVTEASSGNWSSAQFGTGSTNATFNFFPGDLPNDAVIYLLPVGGQKNFASAGTFQLQLAPETLAFLQGLSSTDLANARFGFDIVYFDSQNPEFTLEVVAEPNVVPEPATMLLVGSGLAAAVIRRRGRRQRGSRPIVTY